MPPRASFLLHWCASAAVAGMILASAGCNTAYLAPGEKIYTGADVIIEEKEDIPDKGDLEDHLDVLVKPEPNGKLFGLFRLKLWLYNIGFFGESLGEPPVLLRSVEPERIAAQMRTLLENKGHFFPVVRHEVREEETTAEIRYTVTIQSPYTINGVVVKGDSTALVDSIRATMSETLLRAGEQYDLVKLKLERERIDAVLKEKGFFYFAPDFIVFQADSTAGEKTVNLSLRVSRNIPVEATRPYMIGNIYIYSGYSLDRDSIRISSADTVIVDGCVFIDLDKKFEPRVIVQSMFFKEGTVYKRSDHELTLSRMMNLGVFKFVNIRFSDADSAGFKRLEPHVYLTPLLTKTIRFELQGVSKSNNLVGPVLESSYRNRNIFGGAELLKLSFEAGFETPLSTGQSGGNSYEFGARGELDLPEFVTPFTFERLSSLFVPKTRLMLGFRLLDRVQYYQLFSVDASIAYNWKTSVSIEHTVSPLAITFARLTNRTGRFNDLLSGNPLLQKSFEEQFIVGQTYSFTYNDQLLGNRKNHVYFKGNVDFSGGLLNVLQSLFVKHKATSETPYTLFGKVYSQYIKFDVDARHYYNTIEQTSSLASRVIGGIGVAYGNSAAMPYVKQFYIGGSNSVRAFVAHGLGPGSYKVPDSAAANSFIDQAGSIKLEAAVEYRFPIVSIVNGALFVDAGNIWLLEDDPNRPGTRFSGATFLNEIAIGTGFGVRLDLSFFILRFDLAFPLRVPSLSADQRWVIGKIDFGDPAWRKNNLVLNIAIGYPF